MKKEYLTITAIIFLGVVFSLLFAVADGTIFKTRFSEYADDAESYNRMALNLVERGSFANADGTYYVFVRRSVGYPLFLAGVYSVWRSPVAVWIAQELLFGLAILLVWLIAQRFLEGYWAFLPALLFAIAWFTGTFVVRIGSDFLGMVLGLVFLWAIMCVLEEKDRLSFAVLAGTALAAMALVRPVMLYLIPVMIIFFLFTIRLRTVLAFAAAAVIVVAPVLWWNYATFGTFQLASSGYMLAWRTAELDTTRERFRASTVAAFAGDLVADRVLPGYADNPDPDRYMKEVAERHAALKRSGAPDTEVEALFYEEGFKHIRAHPILFLASNVTNAVRLHTPPNLDGVSMFHFLAARGRLPTGARIALNILVRAVWFTFLAVVLWGAVGYSKRHHEHFFTLLFLALFTLFTIAAHAAFTNAEFRYLLPITPLYIIFASYAAHYAFHYYPRV